MDLLEVVTLGVALGADSLSVSIGIGMGGIANIRACKLASLFGGLQGVLLAAGVGLAAWLHWLLDSSTLSTRLWGVWLADLDPASVHHLIHAGLSIIGACIISIIGVNLIRNYVTRENEECPVYYKGRVALLFLSLSVSLDALSAGIGLGMMESQALTEVCCVVALVIALMALGGLKAGNRVGKLIGRRAEPVGGCLLIILALHLVLSVI